MTGVYLSRVEFEDFRIFGRFGLDIPAAPGLTLLVGTNGLGKSTFFDGIEWCLTGKIRRLEPYVGRFGEAAYLTRRGARPGAHSAKLRFTVGEPVKRTSTTASSEATIAALLKAPGWSDIVDLGDYLAFTHFLGQAAEQRFTSRDAADQWEALKGPSGIDRLEDIRSRLRGAATVKAFKSRETRERIALEQAEADLASWRSNVDRRASIMRRLEALGAISSDAIRARLAAIQRSIGVGPISPNDDLAEATIGARRLVEKTRQLAGARRSELDALRPAAARYAAHIATADLGDRLTAAAVKNAEDASGDLASCVSAAQKAEREFVESEQSLAAANAEVGRLTERALAWREVKRLADSRHEFVEEVRAAEARLKSLVMELEAAHSALRKAVDDERHRLSLRDQEAALYEISQKLALLPQLREQAAAARQSATEAKEAAESARLEAMTLRPQLERSRTDVERSEAVLSALGERASRLAESLAGIAAHLSEHDVECPVCSTGFTSGTLKRLADSAAEREDAALAACRAIHEGLLRAQAELFRALAEIEKRIDAAAGYQAHADSAEIAFTSLQETVVASLGVEGIADPAELVAERRSAIAAALSALDAADLSGVIGTEAARLQVAALESGLTHARDYVRQTVGGLAALDVDLEAATVLLRTLGGPAEDDIHAAIAGWQSIVGERREAVDMLRQLYDAALGAQAAAQRRHVATSAERDGLLLSVLASRGVVEEAVRSWNALGLDGPPTEAALAERLAFQDVEEARLTALWAEIGELAKLQESLAQADELSNLEGAMSAAGGPEALVDPGRHELVLVEQVAQASAALDLTGSTRMAVFKYADRLKGVATEFSTQFLKPLNGLVNDFNHALLATPGETIELSAQHAVNRTSFGMAIRQTDPLDDTGPDRGLPPQLVLSEGQMAANGFSILCAASTAYRWSSWRALLVDDPLQHNDIIHASAFTDVMRNLVALENYQLIMSSHDRSEAEFVARKFDAAGLPCTVVNLTAPAKEGVMHDEPRYNAAARATMQHAMSDAS